MASSLPNTSETSNEKTKQANNLLDDDLFANFNDSNIVQTNSGAIVGNNASTNQNDLGSLIGDFGASANSSSISSSNNNGKIDKSSILALYNNNSASSQQQPQQQQQSSQQQQQSSYQSQLNQLFTAPSMNFGQPTFTNPGIPMSNSQFNLGNNNNNNKGFAQQQPQQKNQLFSDLNQVKFSLFVFL